MTAGLPDLNGLLDRVSRLADDLDDDLLRQAADLLDRDDVFDVANALIQATHRIRAALAAALAPTGAEK